MSCTGLWREYIAPGDEETDPHFRAHIHRLSVIGLRVIAGVCWGGVLYFALALAWLPKELSLPLSPWWLTVAIFLLGLFSLLASYVPALARYPRLSGAFVGYGVALTQFMNVAAFVDQPEVGSFLLSGIVSGILFVGVAALPLKPLHTLSLGISIMTSYGVLVPFLMPEIARPGRMDLVFVSETVFLSAGLTVVVYRQRVLAYRARRSANDAFQQLVSAQAKLLVTENAHSQSRFAAALSHELATPLGALTSAFDTLSGVHKRDLEERPDRFAEVVTDAERSGRESAARLRQIIERMKYLSNLDRADNQVVDLNELFRETVASLKDELGHKAEVHLSLESLPPFRCRPQQLGAVLSNLLRNAAAAIPDRGRIEIASRTADHSLVLEVRDNGRGMTEKQLAHLFEPSFQVTGGRVGTTNWSVFVSRSIVHEHGGELEYESRPGEGTTARIVLPAPGGPPGTRTG